MPTEKEPAGVIARAVSEGAGFIYDRVAVSRETVLKTAQGYDLGFDTWDDYQRRAGLKLMDGIAEGYVRTSKVAVSGLGAAAGFGGFAAIVPDALQFVTLTLRMVTGIAAAYGFDPDPRALDGKVKVLVMQAYLNASTGQAPQKGVEAVALTTTTKLLKTAAVRAELLLKILEILGRLIGLRITREGILKSIPIVASGANAGFNWYYARQIARSAQKELRQFREELRSGKHANDPDFDGLGNRPLDLARRPEEPGESGVE